MGTDLTPILAILVMTGWKELTAQEAQQMREILSYRVIPAMVWECIQQLENCLAEIRGT